jgi:hypothetical protein
LHSSVRINSISSVAFEELNRFLVLLRGGARLERAKVPSLAGLGILLP